MQEFAETIFLNGRVITVDKDDKEAEAVAVCNDKISFVGSTEEARKRSRSEDTVIDLEGRNLIPGFNDTHCHPGFGGTPKLQCYVGYPDVKSITELKETVAKWYAKSGNDQWIIGRGWDEGKYPERRMPTKWDLDEVAPDKYVYLMRACGHMAVVNSKLLSAERIDRNTPDPAGGVIERNSDGDATGLLLGQAHMPLKKRTAPPIHLIREGMAVIDSEFLKNGITSAGDMSGRNINEIRLFQEKAIKREIHYRIYLAVRLTESIGLGSDCLKTGFFTGFGNEWLKLGCFKTQLDGSDTVPSAAMWSPYPGRERFTGTLYMTQEELDKIVFEGHEAGFQISVHAMGTRAIEMALNSFERALKSLPKENHRFRIEHCHLCEERLASRMRDLGVIAVLAPGWIYWNGESYLENYHTEWLDWVAAGRRLMDQGVVVAFHSDLPVIPCNPLIGIYSAVTRKTESGKEVGAMQKMTVKEALRAYTLNGAYASFEDHLKGSIEVGKLADLVVLSSDILKENAENLKSLKVDLTMVNGQIHYRR